MGDDLHLHVHIHVDPSADDKLDQILAAVGGVVVAEEAMALDLDGLTSAVQANTDAESSAVTLIQNLAQEIAAAAGDQTAVTALADQLQQSAADLGAAVAANTPAAPAPAAPTDTTGTDTGAAPTDQPTG